MKLDILKKVRGGRSDNTLPYDYRIKSSRYPYYDGWHGQTTGSRHLFLPDQMKVMIWSLPEGRMVLPLSERCDCLTKYELTLQQAKGVIRNSRFFSGSNPNLNSIDWSHWTCPICHLRAERPYYKLIRLVTDPNLREMLMSYDSDLEEVMKVLNPVVEPNHYRLLKGLKFRTENSSSPGLTLREIVESSDYDESYVRRSLKALEGITNRRDFYGRPYPMVETRVKATDGRRKSLVLTDMGKVLLKYVNSANV